MFIFNLHRVALMPSSWKYVLRFWPKAAFKQLGWMKLFFANARKDNWRDWQLFKMHFSCSSCYQCPWHYHNLHDFITSKMFHFMARRRALWPSRATILLARSLLVIKVKVKPWHFNCIFKQMISIFNEDLVTDFRQHSLHNTSLPPSIFLLKVTMKQNFSSHIYEV